MCIGMGPKQSDMPSVPERQAAKQPSDMARTRAKDDEARRRGMLATILTSAAGVSAPLTSGSAAGAGAGQGATARPGCR
jgi:hypothetical protein